MRPSLVVLALAGCFGGGPVPSTGADAPLVFEVVPASAGTACTGGSTYITSVAFGSDSGYALVYPYGPEDQGCSVTTPSNVAVSVMQFPIDGSHLTGQMVGTAGMSNAQAARPQLALGSNGPVSLFDTTGQPPTLDLALLGGSPQPLTGSGQLGDLAGAAGDYAATVANQQPTDPMNPLYPCCVSGGQQSSPGQLLQYAIAGTQVTATPPLMLTGIVAGELPSAIAANSTAAFYITTKPTGFGIEAVSGSDTTDVVTISPTLGSTPVGLAADDAHVAWAFAQDATQTPLAKGCQIWIVGDAPLGSTNTVDSIFQSSKLSCMDLVLDPNAVYFTIVDEDVESGCDGCTPGLHGVGIGRVDFTMHTFSSIAFDVEAPSSGPRRIYTAQSDPNDVFVADPFVIAKISKMAFAGRTDISP
ncbi:MAG TPA: hypothetical protein VGG74_00735 [Kofleriaceae bacterium]|jgi:hypothetical protein